MTLKELLVFIKAESARLKERYGDRLHKDNILFAKTLKLTEEAGELASEVLALGSLQRSDKLSLDTKEKLAHEVADVIITTLLVAEEAQIDVERALEEKIKKIEARYEKGKA